MNWGAPAAISGARSVGASVPRAETAAAAADASLPLAFSGGAARDNDVLAAVIAALMPPDATKAAVAEAPAAALAPRVPAQA
jgi:hypothetical protein